MGSDSSHEIITSLDILTAATLGSGARRRACARARSPIKPGRAGDLIGAATAAGLRLSEREIRYRLQCARAYPTETQIRYACAEFDDWTALRAGGFPVYDAPPGEPLADHRTEAERDHDKARALADLVGEQGSLLTARFAAHDQKRRAYLEALINAAAGNLDMTWQEAHNRLPDADARDQLSGAEPDEIAADRATPVPVSA